MSVAISDMVGGLPLLTVTGTPRAIGESIGQRLKPRLQLLAQYALEQVAAGMLAAGHRALSHDDIRRALQPSVEAVPQLDPALSMELEAIAHATGLPREDLLLIHGWSDFCSYFRLPQCSTLRSSYVALPAAQMDGATPCAALAWHLEAALVPYLTLVRRIPSHGPATVTLTLAGVHPIAGVSEAGHAVALNALRVEDGVPGQLASNLVATALLAPDWEDALHRLRAGPRHGGGCIHILAGTGQRRSLELSGQQSALLPDPWPHAPRVHCNAALTPAIRDVAVADADPGSAARLRRLAALAVRAANCTPALLARWFALDERTASGEAAVPGIDPATTALLIGEPAQRMAYAARGGTGQPLGAIAL